MADDLQARRELAAKLPSLNGGRAEMPEATIRPRAGIIKDPLGDITIEDHHDMQIQELRAELRAGLARLHRQDDVQVDALRIHQESLLLLTPIVHELDQQTWSGRSRRLKRFVRHAIVTLHEYVRGIEIRLGLVSPLVVDPRGEQPPRDTSRDVPG